MEIGNRGEDERELREKRGRKGDCRLKSFEWNRRVEIVDMLGVEERRE